MEGLTIVYVIKTILLVSFLVSENRFCGSSSAFRKSSGLCIIKKTTYQNSNRIEPEQVLPQLIDFHGHVLPPALTGKLNVSKCLKSFKTFAKNCQLLRPKELQFLLGIYCSIGVLSSSSFTYSSFDLKRKFWRIYQDTDGGIIAPLSQVVEVSSLIDLNGEVFNGLRLNCGPLLWYHNFSDYGKYAYLRLSRDLKLPLLPWFFKVGCRLTFHDPSSTNNNHDFLN